MGNISYTGRITETPKWGKTKNGKPELSITIAEDHRRRKQNSEEWESTGTTWHNSRAFDGQSGLATNLAFDPAINKGALVEVEAFYDSRDYTDREGKPRTYFNETITSLSVKFPPKEEQPAVHPDANGAAIPTEEDEAF